jgi:hypothetical protein
MEKEITMKMIKQVVLDLQLSRLQLELKRDVLDENKIAYLRKDITKLQNQILYND